MYAIVTPSGEIEALVLSKRECGKLRRTGERVERMTGVEWPTWAEWQQQAEDLRGIDWSPKQLTERGAELRAACPFCELTECACVDEPGLDDVEDLDRGPR